MMLNKFLQTTIIVLLLDGIYLSLLSSTFSTMIKNIQKTELQPRYLSFVFTYVIMISGLYYFIIKPNRSVLEGGLLGLLIYGIYDGTNYGIFKNWSIKTFIIDIVWGGFLFATTTKIIQVLH
jgi:uncharacterized membrane protein